MPKAKPIDYCIFCGQNPCACPKAKKPTPPRGRAPSRPKAAPAGESSDVVAPRPRRALPSPRKISQAAQPLGAPPSVAPPPESPAAPEESYPVAPPRRTPPQEPKRETATSALRAAMKARASGAPSGPPVARPKVSAPSRTPEQERVETERARRDAELAQQRLAREDVARKEAISSAEDDEPFAPAIRNLAELLHPEERQRYGHILQDLTKPTPTAPLSLEERRARWRRKVEGAHV